MINPTMPSESIEPPYATQHSLLGWLVAETWDHLCPWSRNGFEKHFATQTAGAVVALAATVVWILAALGRVDSAMVIGWWFGWSLLEVMVRAGAKPYVKEGPWWGRCYRRASLMDMVCYVGFKNLLIGAALFLALKSLGLLTP